jgi:hypothetical protein
MRIFLTILAYLGLIIVLIAALPSLFVTLIDLVPEPADFGKAANQFVIIGLYPGLVGALLALIGGLTARPPYLRICLIIIGLIYIFSFAQLYAYLFRSPSHPDISILGVLLLTSPGIICIFEGTVLRMIEKKKGAVSTATITIVYEEMI